MRPLIGITTARHIAPDDGLPYHRAYALNAEAIAHAGGLPVLLPAGLDETTLRAVYERVDGLLLPGGVDIHPRYIREEPHPTTVVDPSREHIEVLLTRWAVDEDKPLLGICRGLQVMNVALGGTLVQDIPSLLKTDITHDLPRSIPAHPVSIKPGSRLAAILGTTELTVNSLHHQVVCRPAPDIVVTAHAPDELIEAFEIPDRRFALSVQWHPEDMAAAHGPMRRLFEAFVAACCNGHNG